MRITAAEARALSNRFTGDVTDDWLNLAYQEIGMATDRGATEVKVDGVNYRELGTSSKSKVTEALESAGYTVSVVGDVTTIDWKATR